MTPAHEALGISATGAAADAVTRHVPTLVEDRFASRLFAKDASLWGPDAEPEAAIRLGWTGLHRTSRPLLGEIAALREELHDEGVDHVVLCGMGGSSLAPEVICASAGVELTVLDSSDPSQVADAVADRIERTVVVVSSKSGSTVETDSQRRVYVDAFTRAGLDPTRRIVIVTDPGSPLDQQSRSDGYRVVNADPNVGGRYSAMTAFGLVPSGLAGADIEALLDEADAVADLLADDDVGNPALRLGAAMAGTEPLRDKLVIVDEGSGKVGFADWAEQLVAESTGKGGTGILPVVVSDPADPESRWPADDVTVVRLVTDDADPQDYAEDEDSEPLATGGAGGSEVAVTGSLGAQMLLWEAATAVAGRLLGINPFDQPDVESAKKAARSLLEGEPDRSPPLFTEGPVEVRALGGSWADGSESVDEVVTALLEQLDPQRGYLAVMVYLDRLRHAELASCRRTLALRSERPTTFGWGPRFLHSTGQLHKGGPDVGVYLQVTGDVDPDLAVPGRDYTFGRLIAAQAAGDARVLADHGRPVLRLHLTDIHAGIAALQKALA